MKTMDDVVEPEILGEKIQITVKEVREIFFEHIDVMNYFNALDSGVFSLTQTDYNEMPALTMELYTIYKNEKMKIIHEKAKK